MTLELDAFAQECRVPILVGIDCGMTGAIIKNGPDGQIEQFKMPVQDNGVDLLRVIAILKGSDLVIIEKPPMGGFQGRTRLTENSCFSQYKELYGLMVGIGVPFHAIKPQDWQRYLGFPTSGKVGKEVWKQFLQTQAIQRFPGRKVPLYAADAYLLFDIARKLYPIPPDQWP